MKYPYTQFRGRFLPIVQIKLKGEKEWINFNAFVDSGASYSIFKEEMAEILGISCEKGEKHHITIGDGSLIAVYLHEVEINLAGEEFKAPIGFSRRLGIGFNIIGRKGIFDRFRVCFDEVDRCVEFYPRTGL